MATALRITTCRKLEDYKQAILHVGGEVAHLDSVDAASTTRSTGVDGLLLTGGDDVAPARLRRSAAPRRSSTPKPGRDEFEIALVDAARARSCRSSRSAAASRC